MATQTGPRLTISPSCEGCEHRTWSANTSPVVALQSHRVCAHPAMGRRVLIDASTPADCPELPAARLALARSVVAAADDVLCSKCGKPVTTADEKSYRMHSMAGCPK